MAKGIEKNVIKICFWTNNKNKTKLKQKSNVKTLAGAGN